MIDSYLTDMFFKSYTIEVRPSDTWPIYTISVFKGTTKIGADIVVFRFHYLRDVLSKIQHQYNVPDEHVYIFKDNQREA